MHYIYGLANPLLPENHPEYIFYIGQTQDPQQRLGQHLGERSNVFKAAIISEIFEARNQSPILIYLEEQVPASKVNKAEDRWINHYREINPNLTNINVRNPTPISDLSDQHQTIINKALEYKGLYVDYDKLAKVVRRSTKTRVSGPTLRTLLNKVGYYKDTILY